MTYEQAVALLQRAVGGSLRGVDSMALQRLYIPLGIPIGLRSALGIAANAAERKGTSVEEELARKGLYTAPTTQGAVQRGEYATPAPAPVALTGSQFAQQQALSTIGQINPAGVPQFTITPRTPTPTPTPTTQQPAGSTILGSLLSTLPQPTTSVASAIRSFIPTPTPTPTPTPAPVPQTLEARAAAGDFEAQLALASRTPGAPRAYTRTEWSNLQKRLPPEDRQSFESYVAGYLSSYGANVPGYTPPAAKINLPSKAIPITIQPEPELKVEGEVPFTPPVTPSTSTEVAVPTTPTTPTTPSTTQFVMDPITGKPLLDPLGRQIPVGPGGNLADIQDYLTRLARSNAALQQAGIANTLAVRRATTEGEVASRKASRQMYANRQLALNALAQRGITGAPGLKEAAMRSAQATPLASKLEAIRSMQDRIDSANILLAQEQQKKQQEEQAALSDLTRAALISNQLKAG